jgi:hypothetical protein
VPWRDPSPIRIRGSSVHALVSGNFVRMCERAVLTNRPLLELSP